MSQAGTYDSGTFLPNIETVTGNSGGPVGPVPFTGNIILEGAAGSPITVDGDPGTNTLTINLAGAGVLWNRVAINTPIVFNNGYIPINPAATVTFTVPATANLGDTFEIAGMGLNSANQWIVQFRLNQTVLLGTDLSTPFIRQLKSGNENDSVRVVCIDATTPGAEIFRVVGFVGFAQVF